MAKVSVQLRDAYLRGLETNAGDTISIALTEDWAKAAGIPTGEIVDLLKDKEDGQYSGPDFENFTLIKSGNSLTIKADHVYRRFLNGERWNRKVAEGVEAGTTPAQEALKELHPTLGEKVKAIKEPKVRAPREPKAPKEAKTKTAAKSRGPKPVAETPEPGEPVSV